MNMRKYFLITTLLCTAAFASCGGGDDDKTPAGSISVACQPETISAQAGGGAFSISVSTTGKEWGAYTNADWIKVDAQNTTSQQGTMTVTVAAKGGSVTLDYYDNEDLEALTEQLCGGPLED